MYIRARTYAQTSYINLPNIIVAVMLILNQRRRSLRLSCPRARHANSVYATRRANARRRDAIQYGSTQIRTRELAERDSKRGVARGRR